MEPQITTILNRISSGESAAMEQLVPLVYDQMRIIAAAAVKNEDAAIGDPTELVHEAYIRLIGNEKLAWTSRSHFFGACATVIRRILVDHARSRKRLKRGAGAVPVSLDENLHLADSSIDMLELDDALQELAALSERQAKIVELKYFGGLGESEIAEVLGVSRRTISSDWAMARAWLKVKLS